MHSRAFSPYDLMRVHDQLAFIRANAAPLVIGEHCQLNSGGPIGLVVDVADDLMTIVWETVDRRSEYKLPRACVHRSFPT
jgi:hypothetical protein